jgi:hypothetical protein
MSAPIQLTAVVDGEHPRGLHSPARTSCCLVGHNDGVLTNPLGESFAARPFDKVILKSIRKGADIA